MASEEILRKLFKACKKSPSFTGQTDDQIWKICNKYKDKSDSEIKTAIGNLRSKDWGSKKKSAIQQQILVQNKEKILKLHDEEAVTYEEDQKNANNILEEFFNL